MARDGLRPLVAGNWKMNGLKSSVSVLDEILSGYSDDLASAVELLVCPPVTLLHAFSGRAGSAIAVGGQDAHQSVSGAYTGSVSAEMLSDLGATYVILGHSERRAHHRESDDEICAKAEAARHAGLTAIVCVGETREEREAGRALEIVASQVDGSVPDGATAHDTVVAYEPVWAIGTGLTPDAADVAEVHALIRHRLTDRFDEAGTGIRILYGGSVKPQNARELMGVADVNGALVGGASLVAADFLGIARAYLP